MNIDDYRYITTIADLGSFTNAAKELFIAQPSLSQRVKYIENAYGISIFIRDTKGVRLTEDGECFVRHAKQILNCEEDLRQEIADMHDPDKRVLRIGVTQFIRSYLFDLLIRRFHEEHPKIQFEFIDSTSREQQDLLLSGKIDIAICYLPITSPGLKYETIFRDHYVLIPAKGSKLAQKITARPQDINDRVDLRLLNQEPFAIPTPGTRLYDYLSDLQRERLISLDIQHYGKNYSMLYSIAKAGIASTILYESFFDPTVEHEPYYYMEDAEESELSIAVVWRKGAYLYQAAKELIRIANQIDPLEEQAKGTGSQK